MEIVFQEFIDYPDMDKTVSKNTTLDLIYSEIYDFIKNRLLPLKSAIDGEEIEFKEKDPCTIISFLEHEKYGILRFYDYSKDLRIKMKSCFSQSDFDFLYNKIETGRRIMDN